MAQMNFLPFLQNYLNQHQVIYTVRRFLYEPTDGMVYIPGVGACRRELVKSNVLTNEDLAPYAGESGLMTPDNWWAKIREINKGHQDSKLYLYRITKVR